MAHTMNIEWCDIRVHTRATSSYQEGQRVRVMQTRAAALDVTEGLSGSPEGAASLAPVQHALVPCLLACAAEEETSKVALRTLVNLSDSEGLCATVASHGGCGQLVRLLVDDTSAHPDLICMALANISRVDVAAQQIIRVRLTSPRRTSHKCV
jgi:hypothetical protein